MSIMERDVVLQGKDSNGNPTMDFPVTRLGLIEDSAEEKDTPAVGDYIPVLDGKDNRKMKKTPWSVIAALFAKADHTHSAQTSVSGNAGSATKLQTARKIGSASFDGSEDITLEDIGAAAASHTHAVFAAGTKAPSDTSLLWIDTTANTGGLKYYNGTSWVHVPVAYT